MVSVPNIPENGNFTFLKVGSATDAVQGFIVAGSIVSTGDVITSTNVNATGSVVSAGAAFTGLISTTKNLTVTGSIVDSDVIIGKNIVTSTGSIVSVDALVGKNIVSSTGSVVSNNLFAGKNISVTGSIIEGSYVVPVVTIGSPTTTSAQRIDIGTGALGAGSDAWFTFGTAFGTAPSNIIVQQTSALGAAFAAAGSYHAGSFYAQGTTASADIEWVAFGAA